MMERFRFKQFSVSHHQSSMKVGTDAILLAALTDISIQPAKVLDVGTGCGVIALGLAQRTAAQVTAIDIHAASIEEARRNFLDSPWAARLKAYHNSLQDFVTATSETFDLIISNPPYYRNALQAPDPVRNQARHHVSLQPEELLTLSMKILSPQGSIAIILPPEEAEAFKANAIRSGLFFQHQVTILPKVGRPPVRHLVQAGRERRPPHCTKLTIRNENNGFTKPYQIATEDFYINF